MRKLVYLAVAMAVACFLSLYLPWVNLPLYLGLGSLGVYLLCLFCFRKANRLRYLSFGFALGFLWFSLYQFAWYLPSQSLADRTIRLEAQVTGFPQKTEYGISVLVKGGDVEETRRYPLRLYLSADYADLKPGDRLQTIARCHTGNTPSYQRSQMGKGIYLTAQGYGTAKVDARKGFSLSSLPAYVAIQMRESILTQYDAQTSPFLMALLTGWKDDLPDNQVRDFSRTGLSHLVSVSGMHISFLAAALLFLLKKPSKKTIVLHIALIYFFALLTGGNAGAMRAAFLCSVGLLAPLLGRRSDSYTSLFGALAFLLLLNPFSIGSVSLQFSFSSVLGIYLLGSPLYAKLRQRVPKARRKFLDFPLSIFSISLGAMLFTLPLTALYFGEISLISPLANLLTNGLVSFIFLCGMASVALGMLFAPLALPLVFLNQLVAKLFLGIAALCARVPFASLSMQSVYYLAFFAFLYGVCLFSWWYSHRKPIAWVLPLCSLTLAFCLVTVLHHMSQTRDPLSVQVLDIGQGQSVLLQSGKRRTLMDCGGTKDAGGITASTLHSLGYWRLDMVFLSHYHADHTNGLADLFSRVKVDTLILPDSEAGTPERLAIEALAEQYGTDIHWISTEAKVAFGEATLQVFPPLSDTGDNEVGLSVLARYGDWEALMTGDMGEDGERKLIRFFDIPPLDLLVLGHHGSRFSTCDQLLRATTPALAVVSVGRGNSYGHPAEDTLARLEQYNIPLYRTDTQGTLTIRVPREERTP